MGGNTYEVFIDSDYAVDIESEDDMPTTMDDCGQSDALGKGTGKIKTPSKGLTSPDQFRVLKIKQAVVPGTVASKRPQTPKLHHSREDLYGAQASATATEAAARETSSSKPAGVGYTDES
eukprot:SAG22_NODE_11225_length_495_cov_0.477273_1_plen_119_part_10